MTLSDKIVMEQDNNYLCLSVDDVKAFIKKCIKYAEKDCLSISRLKELAGEKLI